MMIRKIALLLVLLCVPVAGTQVQGTVYRWSDLESVPALVQVRGEGEVLHQELLNSSGAYSVSLSKGNYSFIIEYDNLTAYQEVEIRDSFQKNMDFILTPSTEHVFPGVGELPDYQAPLGPEESLLNDSESNQTDSAPIANSEDPSNLMIYLSVLTFLVLITLTYLLKQRGEKRHIPSDEEEVLKLLKEEGGEIYQKQVRESTGFSASKTSELLSKMEEKNLITREKKGREKIVKLS